MFLGALRVELRDSGPGGHSMGFARIVHSNGKKSSHNSITHSNNRRNHKNNVTTKTRIIVVLILVELRASRVFEPRE